MNPEKYGLYRPHSLRETRNKTPNTPADCWNRASVSNQYFPLMLPYVHQTASWDASGDQKSTAYVEAHGQCHQNDQRIYR